MSEDNLYQDIIGKDWNHKQSYVFICPLYVLASEWVWVSTNLRSLFCAANFASLSLTPITLFHWIGFKVRLKNVYNVDKIGFKVRLKCTRMCCGIIWSGLGQLLPVCPEENAARGRHYVIHLFSFVCSQLETGCGYFPSISISKPPRCCATAAKGLTKNQDLHRSHTLVNLLVPFKIIPVCFNDIYFKTK